MIISKKLNNHRILENSNEHDNLYSNDFLNYYNLTIDYSFENNFINISKKWPSNMTEKEYISLLQKQYFLSNLTEF